MALRWAWREQLSVVGPAVIAAVVAFVVALQWVKAAPPGRVVIATGRADGAYCQFAEHYRARLARENITLEVRETSGSVENIRLLEDPDSGVDIAFVQGGAGGGAAIESLRSPPSRGHRVPGRRAGLADRQGDARPSGDRSPEPSACRRLHQALSLPHQAGGRSQP